jgi:hypothetical protein
VLAQSKARNGCTTALVQESYRRDAWFTVEQRLWLYIALALQCSTVLIYFQISRLHSACHLYTIMIHACLSEAAASVYTTINNTMIVLTSLARGISLYVADRSLLNAAPAPVDSVIAVQ